VQSCVRCDATRLRHILALRRWLSVIHSGDGLNLHEALSVRLVTGCMDAGNEVSQTHRRLASKAAAFRLVAASSCTATYVARLGTDSSPSCTPIIPSHLSPTKRVCDVPRDASRDVDASSFGAETIHLNTDSATACCHDGAAVAGMLCQLTQRRGGEVVDH